MQNADFIVVGGGIIGLASAYKLQLKFPEKIIYILEKERQIGMHQTGRNSGVIHSGIYYTPNSYKARNCKKGRDELISFSEKYDVKHSVCGKLIVATTIEEVKILHTIFERGITNGTPGIRFLDPEEIEEKEPYIVGLKAIWVPTAGIIDYVGLCFEFVNQITKINTRSKLILDCKVNQISEGNLKTTKGEYYADKVIFCTGLFADRVAKSDDFKTDMKIVGFRGDYYEMTERSKSKIKNLVYPVPDPNFPFLGVHFTPMVDGRVECGPNAVFSFKREGYKTTSFSFRDSFEALTYKGTWKLFFKHWRKGVMEYKRAFSKRLFVKDLQRMMPSITMDDVKPTRSGVRAQALDAEGNLIDDFKVFENKRSIHVLNAPSPAATSCLAIADEIVNRLN